MDRPGTMSRFPTGTVTFLFTDIEGSTRLLGHLGDRRYAELVAEHQGILRNAFTEHGGQEIDVQGDAFFVAFSRARDALLAAVAAQRAVATQSWPTGASVHVRMGLHTGEPLSAGHGYVGMDVHRAARICSVGHGGQILLSQTTRDLVSEDLPESVSLRDLGEHRLKDLAHPQHLFQVVAVDLPVNYPPLRSLSVVPNNLPIQLTSFVGREHEIDEVMKSLSAARLVTLTGPGGSGKTRLALQVAAEGLGDFPDGVWLVELATLSGVTLVPQTVAAVLHVPEQSGRTLSDTLTDYLRLKSVLLVLDNCEHLISACAHLSDTLLRTCPNLRVLATSREPLGLPGEAVRRVPSLSLPEPGQPASAETLKHYEATRLFIERAKLIGPGFTATDANAPAIVEICRRLDGIPLAIELAAARVKVLTVEQIAARLVDRFPLLTGGSRMTWPHHQTLRGAIDWSYDWLSAQEQTLLRRLSVFAGGWVFEAAEAICGRDGLEAAEILDLLTTLVDKSLVMMEPQAGEARYGLLETIRQYAWEKLLISEEVHTIQDRHRDWYLGFAERADPELRGPKQSVWLQRLVMENENLRAALEFSIAEGNRTENALRLTGALQWFWYRSGYNSEGLGWLETALAKGSTKPSLAREKALRGAGMITWRLDNYNHARELLQQSLTLARQFKNSSAIASTLHHLGHVAESHGDFAHAIAQFEESVKVFREDQDAWGIAWSLSCMARTMVHEGELDRAVPLYEESMRLSRKAGDEWLLANPLAGLGVVADAQGHYDRAMALLEESLAIFRKAGARGGITTALLKLGHVAFRLGKIERATALYKDSLARRREVGDKDGASLCLVRLAEVAITIKRPKRAAQLIGATEGLLESIGGSLPRSDRLDYERIVSAAHSVLGNEAFHAARAEGRRIEWPETIAFGLIDDA